MVLSFKRGAILIAIAFVFTWTVNPANAAPRELAMAQGDITISEAPTGLRAPSCREMTVEARDALDNHLIAETEASIGEFGLCRYALSVPAQTAVWLRLRPMLVASARIGLANPNRLRPTGTRQPAEGVALRFTIIAATTYFFAPNEQKTIPLTY